MKLHHQRHGEGKPLLLLHGGFGSGEMFEPLLPELTAVRQVITVDLAGHGRSPDPGRPLRAEHLADDLAELIADLRLGPVDVAGYSLGGEAAVRLAIQHPDTVERLVLISVAARRDGNHPEVVEMMNAMGPEAATFMRQSPAYELYARIAPRPEDFDLLVARTADALNQDYDWTDEVTTVTAPTLLVFADADSIRPDHIVELYALLGGGLRDASWDGSLRPLNQLAILPGTTHYDIYRSPALAPTLVQFLGKNS